MADNKVLAESIAAKIDFQPSDDRILVKPLKPVMITKLLPTPPKVEPKSVEEAENAEPTEPTKQKVEANVAKGIVLVLGSAYTDNNPEGIAVGDVVYFHRMSGMPFELLKDSRLLRRYEVLGKAKSTELS
jgi:co-chaperonin GroES (HSP10)